jgi:hypothetical protein
MFLCKHYRAGKGQHHLPGVHGCTNVKLGQRSSSAWQTENNEFGNLKNNFTSSTREQTFLGILMFLGLIYIYLYNYITVQKHRSWKVKNWSCTKQSGSANHWHGKFIWSHHNRAISPRKVGCMFFSQESVWKTIRTRVLRLSSRTVNSKVQNRPRWPALRDNHETWFQYGALWMDQY